MILEIMVAVSVAVTGGSCAAIDNATNQAVWDSPSIEQVSTTYRDIGILDYNTTFPTDPDTILALVTLEGTLQDSGIGRKIRVECIKPIESLT